MAQFFIFPYEKGQSCSQAKRRNPLLWPLLNSLLDSDFVRRENNPFSGCVGIFYLISNFLLLEKNCILVFTILGRKKTSIWSISYVILVFPTLPVLSTFSNYLISALLMSKDHISPKPSSWFLASYLLNMSLLKHSPFEVS